MRAGVQAPVACGDGHRLIGIIAVIVLIVLAIWNILIQIGPIKLDGDDWIAIPSFAMLEIPLVPCEPVFGSGS